MAGMKKVPLMNLTKTPIRKSVQVMNEKTYRIHIVYILVMHGLNRWHGDFRRFLYEQRRSPSTGVGG